MMMINFNRSNNGYSSTITPSSPFVMPHSNNAHLEIRKLLRHFIYYLTTIAIVSAQDNFFCGTSWDDASSNCDMRQPCPSATDEECSYGLDHVCFGDTTCSIAAGDGSVFAYLALADLPNVDYHATSNKKFCGTWYGEAGEMCSIGTYCSNGRCPDMRHHCFETTCNIQDLVKAELGEDWASSVTGSLNDISNALSSKVKLSANDSKRQNFCGLSWAHASKECTTWCRADGDDCPEGQKCFASTSCFYDADLQPSVSPLITPQPTRSPLMLDDPINFSFCGASWALATQKCSPETNCMFDSDCTKEGDKCFPALPGCNLSAMGNNPKPNNNINGGSVKVNSGSGGSIPSDFRFCGTSWDDASDNCSLDRHCPNYICADRALSCFDNISLFPGAEFCNAHEMKRGITRGPTLRPTTETPTQDPTTRTSSPSKKPTDQPTTATPTKYPTPKPTMGQTDAPVQIINGLCAYSFQQLQQTYLTARTCSNIDPCAAGGQICFPNVDVAFFQSLSDSPSKPPSSRPTTASPVTRKPSSSPSQRPTTPYPTYRQTYPPTETNYQNIADTMVGKLTGNSSNKRRFYCGTSLQDIKQTCGPASECDFSGTTFCPSGQACMPYNDCKQTQQQRPGSTGTKENVQTTQQNSGSGTEEGNSSSTPWNYFPDICPLGFFGLRSPEGDCKQYYECSDGIRQSTYKCDVGFMFDNGRGKCMDQQLINSTCETTEGNNHQSRPNESEGENNNLLSQTQHNFDSGTEEENQSTPWNYFPDLCPLGFVGSHSPEGDCKTYFECKDGLLENSGACDIGFMFDNSRVECVDQRLVNKKCQNIELEDQHNQPHEPEGVKNEQQQQPGSKDKDKNLSTQLNYSPDLCPSGFVGTHSHAGKCKQYYDCKDGFLEASHTCDMFFMFDNTSGKCISQQFVNSMCVSTKTEGNSDQNQPKEIEANSNDNSQPHSILEPEEEQHLAKEQNNQSDSTPEHKEKDQMGVDPSNHYMPALCPLGFNGFHATEDCKKYYKCSDGYVGIVHTCSIGYKFDKVRGECISEHLVSPYCYGPALGPEEGRNQELGMEGQQNAISPGPSPASVGRPMPSSNMGVGANEGDTTFLWSDPWSDTASPTVPSDPGVALWLRDYDNGERPPARISLCLFTLALLPTLWVMQR